VIPGGRPCHASSIQQAFGSARCFAAGQLTNPDALKPAFFSRDRLPAVDFGPAVRGRRLAGIAQPLRGNAAVTQVCRTLPEAVRHVDILNPGDPGE